MSDYPSKMCFVLHLVCQVDPNLEMAKLDGLGLKDQMMYKGSYSLLGSWNSSETKLKL